MRNKGFFSAPPGLIIAGLVILFIVIIVVQFYSAFVKDDVDYATQNTYEELAEALEAVGQSESPASKDVLIRVKENDKLFLKNIHDQDVYRYNFVPPVTINFEKQAPKCVSNVCLCIYAASVEDTPNDCTVLNLPKNQLPIRVIDVATPRTDEFNDEFIRTGYGGIVPLGRGYIIIAPSKPELLHIKKDSEGIIRLSRPN